MDNIQINEVSAHKHFGVIFSNDCTWHDHLENIKKKAWTRVNVMKKLKFKLDKRSLQTIYIYFISKKISNDQELIQSDPKSCPQNQKGNN